MENLINYPLASDTWDASEVAAIERVVRSNRYTMGHEVAEFEKEFAKFIGSKHAVMTNSGSSANLIAISTLAYNKKFHPSNSPQDLEIIVPSVSWSTTYFPVHQLGYTLRFVDVDPNTFNISVEHVISAISERTAAIFTVNLLGSASELEKLEKICREQNITLIEDNCESFGAKLDDGRFCGTIGKMGTFSFFFSHHLQTMEGGMVVTDDDDIVDYLRSFRAHGWVRDITGTKLYNKSGDDFEDSYKFVLPGYCVRPLEFCGAVGRVQLKKWPDMIHMRRENAKIAQQVFSDDDFYLQSEHGYSSWFGFGLMLRNGLLGKRQILIEKLKELNVEVRPIVAGNFQNNPVTSLLRCVRCDAPGADAINSEGFFIGNDCVDLETKIIKVSEVLRKFKDKK